MAEEIDDNDFFQQDFTTASEWEIFNARLEEIFHEWKLPFSEISPNLIDNQLSFCNWVITSETIFFADVELHVTRYKVDPDNLGSKETIDHHENTNKETDLSCQAFIDLASSENSYCILDERDESSKIHPIARWYGLRDFVIISPTTSISNESQIRILLSSIHIAVSESQCEVPVFIQVLEKNQNVYLGVCENRSFRLNFDIVHLHTTPPTCKYLQGLLNMFKGKVGVQYSNPAIVTVRLSYNLLKFFKWNYLSSNRIPFADDDVDMPEDETNSVKFNVLSFGSSVDPITEILLYCTWPKVVEDMIIDSPIHSDLNPMLAQNLSVRLRFEDLPICYMSDTMSEYLHLTESRRGLLELLGDSFIYGTNTINSEKNPFDLLTESKIPKLTSVLPSLSNKTDTKKGHKMEGPIEEIQLMYMLYYVFPDAQKGSDNQNYFLPDVEPFDPLKLKTAYPDSLVHRLSCLLALCNSSFGGIKALAQLWAEFSQEMRYRVENCIQIPGVSKGFPDSRTCLLHQKLQMLNICMERRKIREGGLPFSMTGNSSQKRDRDEDEEDDEFFDCSDEEEDSKRHAHGNKPEGRLSRLAHMTLVDSEDEPLYIPMTQDPVPKTEDQLEDDAEVMLKLGPGSELRAQMMSASLLSDMESFKAANPNGKIEDFIRWYSPRDWIQEDVDEGDKDGASKTKKKGHLSSRMLIPGNTWQTVWEQSKPVPARRQKRLFDDAKEAEKVLHFFESRNIGNITQLTLAPLFHSSIIRLQSELALDNCKTAEQTDIIDKIILSCCKLSRENWISFSSNVRIHSNKKWEMLLSEITNMEYLIEKIRSIKKKLFSQSACLSDKENKIVSSLLKGHEVTLKDGVKDRIAVRIFNIFNENKNAQNEQQPIQLDSGDSQSNFTLPSPIEKQFTMRLSGKTVNKGDGGPQFLRAILGQNEFRLCGAFSANTTFY